MRTLQPGIPMYFFILHYIPVYKNNILRNKTERMKEYESYL